MNIMVVDDDSTFIFIFKKQIDRVGDINLVNESSNGSEALAFLNSALRQRQNVPDIVILDLNMPIMNGWTFLDEYSKLCEKEKIEIPVCILSSTINQADFDKANTYQSVKSFFSKPITMDQILSMKKIAEIY